MSVAVKRLLDFGHNHLKLEGFKANTSVVYKVLSGWHRHKALPLTAEQCPFGVPPYDE